MKNRKLMVSLIAGLLVFAMALTFLVGLLPQGVNAASSSTLKEQLNGLKKDKDKITAKLEELKKQQQENVSDMEGVIAQKGIIEQQVQLLYEQIANVNAQISTYSQLIADKQKELDEAQKKYDKLNAAYKKRIRTMEEAGELSYWSVLFKASSFSDFLDRVNMIREIAFSDTRRLEELTKAAQEVEQAKKELQADKADLEKNRKEMEEAQVELDAKSVEADRLLMELVSMGNSLEDLHNQFEKEEEEFMDKIAQAEKEYNSAVQAEKEASKKASQQASKENSKQVSIKNSIKASQNQATAPTGGGSSNVGANNPSGAIWLVPCTYSRISSKFGMRWHPTTGEWSMHRGVDLAAPKGTPIYASRSGTISKARYSDISGNYVTIRHGDGWASSYMHMTHYVVSEGDYVVAGQLIGYVGSTGRSTGPHLHFAIFRVSDSEYFDPMKFIG